MNQNVVQIGYFGLYARGDWEVGSDLRPHHYIIPIRSSF
jgi:hypothetical protein